MTLAEIVTISGLPGLYKITAKRSDGLIVTSLIDDKAQFAAVRTHPGAPLDTITVFTQTDSADLKQIFKEIKKQESEQPVPDVKEDAALKSWFEKILPDYDREKVYISHIKKLASWYNILNNKNLIEELTSDEAVKEVSKDLVQEEVKKESKPKRLASDKSAKAHSKPAPAAKKITTPRKAS